MHVGCVVSPRLSSVAECEKRAVFQYASVPRPPRSLVDVINVHLLGGYKRVRNVMAHAQKPDLVFQRNGRVHLNRRGCQFSRLLVVEECGQRLYYL